MVPTLAFFTPDTGELVHLGVGAQGKSWLMELAKLAQDPQNNLSGMMKRFKNGERDEMFLEKYLAMLDDNQKRAVVSEYLNDVPEKQFVSTKAWEMFVANIRNPMAKAFQRVMAERQKFYSLIGQDIVDHRLSSIIRSTIDDLTGKLLGGQYQGSGAQSLKDVVAYLKSIDYSAVPGALISVKTAEYHQKGDFVGMLNYMKEVIDAKLFMDGEARQFLVDNLSALALCPDVTIINKGIEWIDNEFKLADDYLYQSNLLHVKSVLLRKLGKADLAKQAEALVSVYLDKAEKKGGGHIMRVFKIFHQDAENRIL